MYQCYNSMALECKLEYLYGPDYTLESGGIVNFVNFVKTAISIVGSFIIKIINFLEELLQKFVLNM